VALTAKDCLRCGACCTNPDENRAERFVDWVEVGANEPLRARADLVKKHVVVNARGERHLRLDPSGRCTALRGRLGRDVSCAIYALRPAGCRHVEPGSARCVQYRAERGIG
jgi:Fe-S-cluster containining protein